MRLALLAVGLVVVLAGCLGGPGGGPTTTTTASTTDVPDTTVPPTTDSTPETTDATTPDESLGYDEAGERAIDAEKARIDRLLGSSPNVTDVSFGILGTPEYEVTDENETGLFLRVSVSYSVEFDCDGDGDPESSADGANTITRYFVSTNAARLLSVEQDVMAGDAHCD
jgi:hypothetical protein